MDMKITVNFPRGRDTRNIFGFNYRMTEIQGAIGKVQLKKLDSMISDNKRRYNNVEKELSGKFILRRNSTTMLTKL